MDALAPWRAIKRGASYNSRNINIIMNLSRLFANRPLLTAYFESEGTLTPLTQNKCLNQIRTENQGLIQVPFLRECQ